MRFSVRTAKGVAEAAAAVDAALAARRFSVLWAMDVNEKLQEKGLSLNGQFRILEVCSAPRAKQALETNPAISYFLPCKVVVQQAEGGAEIGFPRPTALIGLVGDDRLNDLAREVEDVLLAAVREAAG